MKTFWQRFTAALTPGVRMLLVLLAAAYLLALLGKFTRTVDLYRWLAVDAPDFWHGQIWRVLTYALLPVGVLDFLTNGFALVILGSMLERHWTRGELWLFCGVAAAGAGLASVFLGVGTPPLAGASPMVFGLLVAWAFVSGHEVVLVPLFGQVTVWRMVLILAAMDLLIMAFSAGVTMALITSSGGLTGWLYLWVCHKWLMARASRTFQSERINRLEL